MKYAIEDGVPIITRVGSGVSYQEERDTMRSLKPGQSFLIPANVIATWPMSAKRSPQAYLCSALDGKFVTRKIRDNGNGFEGIRIWRLE